MSTGKLTPSVKLVSELTNQELAYEYTMLTGEKLGKISDRKEAEGKLEAARMDSLMEKRGLIDKPKTAKKPIKKEGKKMSEKTNETTTENTSDSEADILGQLLGEDLGCDTEKTGENDAGGVKTETVADTKADTAKTKVSKTKAEKPAKPAKPAKEVKAPVVDTRTEEQKLQDEIAAIGARKEKLRVGVANSWQDQETRDARTSRIGVKVEGHGEYKSVGKAFDALKLSASKFPAFRAALKKAGTLKYAAEDGREYVFSVTQILTPEARKAAQEAEKAAEKAAEVKTEVKPETPVKTKVEKPQSESAKGKAKAAAAKPVETKTVVGSKK